MNLLLIVAFLVAMVGAFSGFFKVTKNSSFNISFRKKVTSILSGILFILAGITALWLGIT